MYKDKAESNQAAKERMRKMRRNEGVTSKGVTSIGVTSGDPTETDAPSTEIWYPNKRTDEKGRAITPVILSDGQKWYPRPFEVTV